MQRGFDFFSLITYATYSISKTDIVVAAMQSYTKDQASNCSDIRGSRCYANIELNLVPCIKESQLSGFRTVLIPSPLVRNHFGQALHSPLSSPHYQGFQPSWQLV